MAGDADGTGAESKLEAVKEQVLETIKQTFKVSPDQAAQLYSELFQCVRKKHLVSVKN